MPPLSERREQSIEPSAASASTFKSLPETNPNEGSGHDFPSTPPKQLSRRQSLIQTVREEVEDYRSGQIIRLSSNRELGIQFGYGPGVVETYLRETGVAQQRGEARKLDWKRKVLVAHARNQIERMREGEIKRTPTLQQLAEAFGYSFGRVSQILREEGISREGAKVANEKEIEIPGPSRDLAWILGLLAGNGEMTNKTFLLKSKNDELQREFKTRGEYLFKTNASPQTRRKASPVGEIIESEFTGFNSTKAVRFLGDLRKTQWPRTIIENHRWLLDSQAYIWGLLEGFFDTKGRASTYRDGRNQTGYRLKLSTSSLEAANFLVDLLSRVGVETATIRWTDKSKKTVSHVQISNLRDIKLFAHHVHSNITEKERELDYFRDHTYKVRQNKYSDEELIKEWMRAKGLLGHSPSFKDLAKLHREGLTLFDGQIYTRRFGQGSFVKAKETLEKSKDEVTISAIESSSEANRERQIYP